MAEVERSNELIQRARLAWLAKLKDKDCVIYNEIMESLDGLKYGRFTIDQYAEKWQEILYRELEFEGNPFDFISAYKYRTYREFFDALRGKPKRRKKRNK